MGDTVKIGGGDYGWVIDKEKEKAQIYEDLAQGGAITREPVYNQTAIQYGPDDIGPTYIEIDYTNQHLWYYKEGELVLDTDIVSGNINKNNGSPDGVYKIVYKERNATLVGEGYSSPVDYFMPFAYNVGIHDASWRSQFGGTIYKTSGSHGCINAPAEIAKELFEQVEVGTPVIAYYRETVYLRAENHRISNAYSYVSDEKYKELQKKGNNSEN
jgi:lipoprotein-anchoring transpeptidase ErfK/SrfK